MLCKPQYAKRNPQIRTLIELEKSTNLKREAGDVVEDVVYLHFIPKELSGKVSDLILLFGSKKLCLFSVDLSFCNGKEFYTSNCVGQLCYHTKFTSVSFERSWSSFFLISQKGELYALPVESLLSKCTRGSTTCCNIKSQVHDIFSDLLGENESNPTVHGDRKCIFQRIFDKDVVHVNEAGGHTLVLCFKVPDIVIFVLSKTSDTSYNTKFIHKWKCRDSIGRNIFDYSSIILTSNENSGQKLLAKSLFFQLDVRLQSLTESVLALVGFPDGKVYSLVWPAIENATSHTSGGLQINSSEMLPRILFDHQEVIKGIIPVYIKSTEAAEHNANPASNLLLFVGKQGRVKLVWVNSENSYVHISSSHTEGPITDYAFKNNENMLITACPKCINIHKLSLGHSYSGLQQLANDKKKSFPTMTTIFSFPITISANFVIIASSKMPNSLNIITLSKHYKVLYITLLLCELLNQQPKSSILCHENVMDLLQKLKVIDSHRRDAQEDSLECNRALFFANAAFRVLSDVLQDPSKSKQVFPVTPRVWLDCQRKGFQIGLSIQNLCSINLEEGWSIVSKIHFHKNWDGLHSGENIVWHKEILPYLLTGDNHTYTITSSAFLITLLPCKVEFLLSYELGYENRFTEKDQHRFLAYPLCNFMITVLDVKDATIDKSSKISPSSGGLFLAQHDSPHVYADSLQGTKTNVSNEGNNVYTISTSWNCSLEMELPSANNVNDTVTVSPMLHFLFPHNIFGSGCTKKEIVSCALGPRNNESILLKLTGANSGVGQATLSPGEHRMDSTTELIMTSNSLFTLSIVHEAICQKLMRLMQNIGASKGLHYRLPKMKESTSVNQDALLGVKDQLDVFKETLHLLSDGQESFAAIRLDKLIKELQDLYSKLRTF